MARRLHDAILDSRDARRKLAPRGEPYYRSVERGVHLGYRRRADAAGTWLMRVYAGDGYRAERIGTADDLSDADGDVILTYWQAVDAVRRQPAKRTPAEQRHEEAPALPTTIADAMDAYIEHLRNDGRSAAAIADARYRDRAFIRPALGGEQLATLTSGKLKRWRDRLAQTGARLRTREGQTQNHRASDDGRARRASANRIWTVLRAALNHAFESGAVASDVAWRKVRPFRNVDVARVRYLTIAEARRLINASDAEFRPLLQAALLCGARYGQLTQLTAADFNPDVGTLRLRSRKGDGSEKVNHVHLSAEAVGFFRQLCAGRASTSSLFTQHDGSPWGKSAQVRPIRKACARAKISPPANFHITRHTWASHAVMNGVPLLVVAKSLGHADTRMVEKHYGHLAPSYIAEAIRAGAPKFGFKPNRKLTII
jgi:integrase